MLMRCASHTSARSGDEISTSAPGKCISKRSDDRPSGGSRVSGDGTVEIQRSSDGHFYADVEINGAPVHALVDTGASGVALSRDEPAAPA